MSDPSRWRTAKGTEGYGIGSGEVQEPKSGGVDGRRSVRQVDSMVSNDGKR